MRVSYRKIQSRRSVVLAVIGISLILASCLRQSRWKKTDAFLTELRCGMSRDAVKLIVAKYHGLELYTLDPESGDWDLQAVKGNTDITMKFDAAGLRIYQISWIDTIKHVVILPEVDLCAVSTPTSVLLEEAGSQVNKPPQ